MLLQGCLINSRKVVRLDFVHATAATERWTEKVRILEREMPATCLSLRTTALRWIKRAEGTAVLFGNDANSSSIPMSEAQWIAASPEVRGYTAYASRQASIYISFATDAEKQFEEVVGIQRWKGIWSAYDLDLDKDDTAEE